ncbi:hypothetical protein CANINC_004858 [Pichia inconspicua]|uniref:Major facilitator superfamily (MFS) profile domain-containing protein n=1 Tax=Pichia inconspicua TaxID=52247 RepID=A0A4T0WUX5_9ASCO|nr:hypothetical protein CANINC_004858 [[Candida] inconspicua]
MTGSKCLHGLLDVAPEPLQEDNYNNKSIERVIDQQTNNPISAGNNSIHSNLTVESCDHMTLTTSEDLKLKSFVPLTFYCTIIALGGFVYGYDIGTIGGIIDMPAFVGKFADGGNSFKPVTKGLLVSVSCLGGFTSGLISSQVIPRIGMRWMIFLALNLYSLADLLILFAVNWKIVVAARIFNGIAFGSLTITCPMYISEITPLQYRGIYTCFTQLFITIGIVVGALTVWFTSSNYYTNDVMQYQYPVFQGMLISMGCGSTIWLVPESPKWLVHRSKTITKVKKSLSRINHIPMTDESIVNSTAKLFDLDFQERRSNKLNEKSKSIRRGKPKYLIRTLSGILLYGFQQYTGINFFFFYGLMIFESVNLKSTYVIPVIFGFVNLIFSLLSIFLISCFKRKTLLLFGSTMMAICMVSFTIIGTLLKASKTIPLILLSCSFISIFSITWGPIATIVISEMYPSTIKIKAMSICGSCSWIFNFSVALMIPTLSKVIGLNIGYGFTIFTCLSIPFVYFYIPETKGKSSRRIDSYYENFRFNKRIGVLQ